MTGLHFDRAEIEERIAKARVLLGERGLSALLIFAPESHYYLTGYDSTGYLFFQAALLCADDEPVVLLTRRPDLQQAKETSVITDIRIWYNAEDANPARELRAIMEEKGLGGERVGIELDTYGMTGAVHEQVRRAMDGWCRLEDASDLVRGLRAVKSPAEIACVRRSAKLADDALLAMLDASKPGVLDTAVTAAGLSVILEGGGDVPPAGPLVNAGHRALYGRSVCGAHRIGDVDQVTIEFAASFHRYTACVMRTAVVGRSNPWQEEMFTVTRDALAAMTEAARPGRPLGEIDDAHRRVFDSAGYRLSRYSACGYSLGATYRPSWMDVPPMLFSGNRTPAQPGMVLFLHAMLPDAERGLAMSAGYTILVTDNGCEILSRVPLEYPLVDTH